MSTGYAATDIAALDAMEISGVDERYLGSPFLPLKTLPSRSKGAQMEAIVRELMAKEGHEVDKPASSEHDMIIDGLKVELKGSFLWSGSDTYVFQQIRDQDYDILVAAAFAPDELVLLAATKEQVRERIMNDEHRQHGGGSNDSGTWWIRGSLEDLDWMRPLEDVLAERGRP